MPNTFILSTDDPCAIQTAMALIKNGGTIAFPTDTIYGLAVDLFNPDALKKIYKIKKRSTEKAIPVLIGSINQLEQLVFNLDERAIKIAHAFWPGPLTLILPKKPELPNELSPYPTIGVRMPDHPFTLSLLNTTGPLGTTSANISGDANPRTARDVFDQLGGKIDLILDGGPTPGPTASTVLDTSVVPLRILRDGPISASDINALFEEDIL